jgi:transcriptional regulator with XRE-family HTH domain
MPRRRTYPPDSVVFRFGRNLAAARTARGITQQQLADAAGCSKSTVVTAEGAAAGVSLVIACAFARVLGLKVSDLAGEGGERE